MESVLHLDICLEKQRDPGSSSDLMSHLELLKHQKDAMQILEKPISSKRLVLKEVLTCKNLLMEKSVPIHSSKRSIFFKAGELVDCLDKLNKWYESTIREIKDGKVLIHYNEWPSRWDEWIPVDSARLAPAHTYTSGPYVKKGLVI
jgi:hypothetical protein